MRRVIVKHAWSRRSEPIEALVLGCVDPDLKGWRGIFAEYMGFSTSVRLTIPGGIKDLVYPKYLGDREYLLRKIGLLVQHNPNIKLIGMAHNECLDCDRLNDPDYYEDMLIQAGRLLQRRFPGQERHLVYLEFDGGVSLVEDEMCLTA